jgi:hypothetical protein
MSFFSPSVEKNCKEQNLNNRALLVLNYVSGHAINTDNIFILVTFTPPNISYLLPELTKE